MYVAMVDVPAVAETYWPQMMYTKSNSCREPMIDMKHEMRTVGPRRGSVMFLWICQ